MRHIRLKLQYDGTEYAGWQKQPDMRTIQGQIEEVLYRLTSESTRVIAAGRTDAGVHAIEQVASFHTSREYSTDVFKRAMNAMLPPDIRVISVDEADEGFHPRYSAKRKRYIYLIDCSSVQSPFLRKYAYHLPRTLDVEKMKEASFYLLGRRDFRAFQASGCGARTTVREVYRIDIEPVHSISFLGFQLQGTFIRFTIEANAFLRYMVRTIVGTLVEVGIGRLLPPDIQDIILSTNRQTAGPTLPAHGLFLAKIYY